MICRECGARVILRSRFETDCTECGSDDLEEVNAYDPIEHELQCEYCGYTVDTSTRPDAGWGAGDEDTPTSVDDPCPICLSALVPRSEARSVRDLPEHKLAREAARKLHRERGITGPPYELEPLAASLGLDVKIGAYGHDGMLVGMAIEIPTSASPAARRFALAHEIGHFVLRHEGERSKAEPEANALASELLIPREELLRMISSTPSLRALCTRFGVSRQAMVYAVMAAKAVGWVRS